MKLYNSYILLTATILLLTTVILVAMKQTSLNTFFNAYVIESLIITELYAYFNARARAALTRVGLVLFGGFFLILLAQVITIIAGMLPA